MTEFWKTVRAYRKWFGWIAVGGFLVLNLNMGWITMDVIDGLVAYGVGVIRALIPGGVAP